MEKAKYVMPDFEIVRYSEFDVIATSGTGVVTTGEAKNGIYGNSNDNFD